MTFAELEAARRLFDLPERATLREIKARHRALVKRFHPDAGGTAEAEPIRRINTAYRVLAEYCAGYRFSFCREEFYEQQPEERLREQFAQDPVWGGGEGRQG